MMCPRFKADEVLKGQSYQNEICEVHIPSPVGRGPLSQGPLGERSHRGHVAPAREHVRRRHDKLFDRMVKK